ncbi:hypothetical protein H6P81_011312 [Aristolochia fimbriata]|uniref:Methyltransferase type 11 domain-containing protein n=1 Tax=Aristolochia fimbriata TaxID=158543 RepID=A0AAV7EUN1_ARIFI|nr:hypothetical protein H6P81_011312 [Aristolochia fimbriata]
MESSAISATALTCNFSTRQRRSSAPPRRAIACHRDVKRRTGDPFCARGNRTIPAKTLLSQNAPEPPLSSDSRICICGRRHFLEASGAALLPIVPVNANASSSSDPMVVINKFRPQRPRWYEEFYALEMAQSMGSFEKEVAGYMTELFSHLKGEDLKVLELGIGTGPNLKYYAGGSGLTVVGLDPNEQMAKYATAASIEAGLPSSRFNFIRGVAEALPLTDGSMDAVVGTLVLCSVSNVAMSLKEVKRVLKPGGLYLFLEHVAASDGTALRFFQSILDPLQQAVSDGCHLTRETGKEISKTGFSELNINSAMLSKFSLICPIVYGVACK